jgi:hypothetical protein
MSTLRKELIRDIIADVNIQFRKVTKTKSTLPSDQSLLKML